MYNILTTLFATVLISLSWDNVDGGYLFKFALIIGGVYIGHVLTETLNENNSDNV